MGLVWLGLIIVAIVAVVLVRSRRGKNPDDAIAVAHSDRLTRLPGYRSAMTRYRALLIAIASVLGVGVLASAALTMRFASVTAEAQDLRNRDIVLCLDVSGSMVDYDARVVDVFGELAQEFAGERLSLVVFNASAVTYFPLTSDTDYILDQFATLQEEFASPDQSYYAGTLVGDGSSLVGDGLASCVTRFDSEGPERSRSVVLVTDNLVAGDPIFTLPEAGRLASERGVRVYGINPGDQSSKDYLDELAQEYQRTVTETGGGYYALDDPGTIPTIVDEITSQQAALSKGPVQVVYDDQPGLATWLIALGLVVAFLLAWRVRR
jgi:Ca-activated chloride channel family protein